MVDFTLHVQFPLPFQHPASNRALPGCWELGRRFQKHPHKPRKSANVDSWEAKTPPGSWTSGIQGSSLRRWGKLLHLSLDTAQWECRLVTVSQRALYCDWSQARQSDKNENTYTHTHTLSQHFQDLFPQSPRAAGRAAGRGNGPEVPSPSGRSILLHSLPTIHPPWPPLLAYYFQGGSSWTMRRIREWALGLGPRAGPWRAWAPTLAALLHLTPTPSAGFPEGWHSTDLSPHPCGTLDSWRLSPHFLSPTAWWPLVSVLPLEYNS